MAKVKIAQGWLQGEYLTTVTGETKYYSFKGIPYAEPPLGKLRFKAPRPPLPWNGVRKAMEHSSVCPQIDIFTQELINGSEDCLYLNVYTPDLNPKAPFPVMFFIHGGAYKSGSGNDDQYGPDFLVAHGVILVTINYRLEAFGFLCLDTEDVPGNAGMKDQITALKWVQENISNFGGDPKNVTIFGESAGGASVIYHTVSPLAKGLFRRAVSMSGVPYCEWSLPYQPRRRAFALGKLLGLDTKDPTELLEFLQKIPTDKFINCKPLVMAFEERSNNLLKMNNFTPVIEKNIGQDHFLTEDVVKLFKSGKIHEVDIFTGYTNEECLVLLPVFENKYIYDYNKYPELFVPRQILIKSIPDQILTLSDKIINHYFGNKQINVSNMKYYVSFTNQVTFEYQINRMMKDVPKIRNAKRYFYKFSCVSNRNIHSRNGLKYEIDGACHLDDLMYLFDAKKYQLRLEKGSKEYDLIQLVCTIFTNFAKYGTPTPDSLLGVTWPEYDNNTKSYVEIGNNNLTVQHDLGAGINDFWKTIYDQAGVEF